MSTAMYSDVQYSFPCCHLATVLPPIDCHRLWFSCDCWTCVRYKCPCYYRCFRACLMLLSSAVCVFGQ